MLNLYYGKLIGKIEEYEGKNYLMVDDFTLDNVLHKIKRVGLEQLDNIMILINTGDKLPNDITGITDITDINDMCH